MTPIPLLTAKEKLEQYRKETYIRSFTQPPWRKNLSQALYKLAERLEPQSKGGRQAQVS
jgi:hypothetical protein